MVTQVSNETSGPQQMPCIRLVLIMLMPLVCVVVRSAKEFCLQCMLEGLQWRQWRDRRW